MAKTVIIEPDGSCRLSTRESRLGGCKWAIDQLHSCKLGSKATVHVGGELTDTFSVKLLAGRPHVVGQAVWPTTGKTIVYTKHIGVLELHRAIDELAKENEGK